MSELVNENSIEERVSEIIIGLGIPKDLKGYRYILSTVMISADDMPLD
jgi:hypothetical protein